MCELTLLCSLHHVPNDTTALQAPPKKSATSSGVDTTSSTAAAASGSTPAAAAATAAIQPIADAELLALLESDSKHYGKVKGGTPHQGRRRLGIVVDPRFVRKEVQEGAFFWRCQTSKRVLIRLFSAADNSDDLYSLVKPK
jgi:hypothetical protein